MPAKLGFVVYGAMTCRRAAQQRDAPSVVTPWDEIPDQRFAIGAVIRGDLSQCSSMCAGRKWRRRLW